MSKPTTHTPPADLRALFRSAGLSVSLTVERLDGAPLTDKDRELLPVLVEGYELGRELNPTDAELTAAVAQSLKATGTGGE